MSQSHVPTRDVRLSFSVHRLGSVAWFDGIRQSVFLFHKGLTRGVCRTTVGMSEAEPEDWGKVPFPV